MDEKSKRNLRRWATALCAAALCLFGGLPAWGQTTYEVTRTARSNTEFTFEMPTNNVEVTVAYVDAGAKITNGSTVLYYVTLADALADAADEGDVITLLANQTLTTGLTITKSITLDLNGKTLTGTNTLTGLTVGTGGALTLTGTGTFSTFATAVKNAGGTLTLSGTPTFTDCTNAFELAEDMVITIGAALTAPTSAYKVAIVNSLPYKITSGFATYNEGADPAAYFVSTTAGVTMRLTESEAEFVTYVALDETTTKPVITNGGQDDDGTREASLAVGNVWIGDELIATTTATPGITWQWYRVSGTTETAISGATAATYTVTTDDLGYTLIAKATQPENIAGTGNPAADVTVASAATTAVVKKDNFGTLTAATYKTYDTDKVNYVKVEVTNATTGVEYLVLASDVEIADGLWTNATTPTADASEEAPFELSQCVSAADGTTALMKPSTSYKLYYRLAETADTKHGTTAETNGKPANEANVAITTRAFDYLVTTQGVTYELSHDATTGRALETTTAKVEAIVGEGTGHKTVTILATIPKDDAGLNERADVWKALGYDVTGETPAFNSDIAVCLIGCFDTDIDLTAIGSTIANYGYIQAMDDDIYDWLKNGTMQTTCSEEGYVVYLMNDGYYALSDKDGNYDEAPKGKTVVEDGMTTKLTIDGMDAADQGTVTFKDKAGTPLPVGTGLNNGKFMAAPGQTVVVEVTLPTGFEFTSDAAKVLNVTYGATTTEIMLADPETTGTWTAEFTMPTKNVTVSFKATDVIQGRTISNYTYTAPSTDAARVTPADDNPSTVRVSQPLVYTIQPRHTGANYYALTDLGLPEGVTATIVDNADGTTPVTLPTEKTVKVTLTVPPTFTGDAVTFAPVLAVCAEDITIAAGGTITYFDTKGLKYAGDNDDVTFATVTSVSGTTVTVTAITNKEIPAETPFLITNTSEETSIRMEIGDYTAVTVAEQFKGVAVDKANGATNGFGPWHWAEDTKYYGFNGTDFVWIKEPGDVAAHRCWIQLTNDQGATGPTSARMLYIQWPDGSVTGIGGISAGDEDGDWYDLNGRKLQARPTKKGVYIKNGTKQVVK